MEQETITETAKPTTPGNEIPNFVECVRKDDANRVDLNVYRFLTLDPYRGYCFMRRQKKGKEASS